MESSQGIHSLSLALLAGDFRRCGPQRLEGTRLEMAPLLVHKYGSSWPAASPPALAMGRTFENITCFEVFRVFILIFLMSLYVCVQIYIPINKIKYAQSLGVLMEHSHHFHAQGGYQRI